jgi:hypothetical protein
MSGLAQVAGKVDRATKEFSIIPNQKVEFMIFGYQYANATTEKLICFASNDNVVRANSNCKLGSYFDTQAMSPGDKVLYLGVAGKFAKMNFVSAGKGNRVFYIPRNCFVIK